jgi:hypothetical protein
VDQESALRVRYLAYGSNMLPARLRERVASARVLGVVRLPGLEVRFHKRGRDGSGKCDLVPSRDRYAAHGVVYDFLAKERSQLDRAEGLGNGYDLAEIILRGFGQVFFYQASANAVDAELRPFDWYLDLVVGGAVHHGLPAPYVARLQRVAAIPDPDAVRPARARRLLTAVQGLVQSAAPSPVQTGTCFRKNQR